MKNIVTIKFGEKYSPETVNTLYNDLEKYYKDFKFWCYTDNPKGLDSNIGIISIDDLEPIHPLDKPNYSHWNRFQFLDDYFEDNNEVITLDIDLRIINDPTPIFDNPLKDGEFQGIHRWHSMVSWDFEKFNKHYLVKEKGHLDNFNWDIHPQYFETIAGGFYRFKPNKFTSEMFYQFYFKKEYWWTYFQQKANLKIGHGEQNAMNALALKYTNLKVANGKYFYTYYTDDIKRDNTEYIYNKQFNCDKYNTVIILQTTGMDSNDIQDLEDNPMYKQLIKRK